MPQGRSSIRPSLVNIFLTWGAILLENAERIIMRATFFSPIRLCLIFVLPMCLLSAQTMAQPATPFFVDKHIIPEGSTASILINISVNAAATINIDLQGLDPGNTATLSHPSVTLTTDKTTALITVSVEDNEKKQTISDEFSVVLTTRVQGGRSPPPVFLPFTIPPNDLAAVFSTLTAFAKSDGETVILGQFTIEDLEADKTFVVFSDKLKDVVVRTGIFAGNSEGPFPIVMDLTKDAPLNEGETLDLKIAYLDVVIEDSVPISAGGSHTCGVKEDGTMACWGSNDNGQTSLPNADATFYTVSAGGFHSCGIRTDYTADCWGGMNTASAEMHDFGQAKPPEGNFRTVSAGLYHSCGIKNGDSTVACWGAEGDSVNFAQTDPTSNDNILANAKFLAVSAGDYHTCGIRSDSTVACWGRDDQGQINLTDSSQGNVSDVKFLAISAGGSHSCGIMSDGTVACWGAEGNTMDFGQADPPPGQFIALSAGKEHTCAIKLDKTVACWGNEEDNRLDLTKSSQGDVSAVAFRAIAAGGKHSCGVRDEPDASAGTDTACWGSSMNDKGDSDGRTNPVPAGFQKADDVLSETTIWLFEKAETVKNLAVINVMVAPQSMSIEEGETDTVAMSVTGLTRPATITLTADSAIKFPESNSAMLKVRFDRDTTQRMVSVLAVDNTEIALSGQAMIALTAEGDIMLPVAEISVAVINDDFYMFGFSTSSLTLSEGDSETVTISIAPAPLNRDTVAVELNANTDQLQLSMDQPGALFQRSQTFEFTHASTSSNLAVRVAVDGVIPEPERKHPIGVAVARQWTNLFLVSTPMTVTVPAERLQADLEVFTDKAVIPEAAAASIFVKTPSSFTGFTTVHLELLAGDLSSEIELSGCSNIQTGMRGSCSVELENAGDDALVTLSVINNDKKSISRDAFKIKLTSSLTGIKPNILSFTIPPSDLSFTFSTLTAFIEAVRNTTRISTVLGRLAVEGLQADKTFAVFSTDPERMIVRTDIFTGDGGSFPVSLRLKGDIMPSMEEILDLIETNIKINHLDILSRSSTRTSAEIISAGGGHTCGIKTDGTPVCWGNRGFRQLQLIKSVNGQVVDLSARKFLTVSAGGAHSCGIETDSTIECWHFNFYGQTDLANSSQGDVSRARFLTVSAGFYHNCGIRADGTVACWGANRSSVNYGQAVPPEGQFLAVSGGLRHSCGIRIDHTIACWGANGQGQRNLANSSQGDVSEAKFLTVNSGAYHSCGILMADNTVTCWGANSRGQRNLANSSQGNVSTKTFLAVSAGGFHTCGIKTDNTVACWGSNNEGQWELADSPQGDVSEAKFLAVSAGDYYTCGLRADGAPACWGTNAASSAAINPPSSIDFRQARLTPDTLWLFEKTQAIENAEDAAYTVRVDNYKIGFNVETVVVEEGGQATATLTILPVPRGSDSVAVNLPNDYPNQVSISPAQVVFTASQSSTQVTVAAEDDTEREQKREYLIEIEIIRNSADE